jgi:hypothetical protein
LRRSARRAQRTIEHGVVDQPDAPERPGRDVGHLRGGLGVSDIERDAEPFPTLSLYQLERGRAVGYVGSNEKRSRRRQALREFLTDSARRP